MKSNAQSKKKEEIEYAQGLGLVQAAQLLAEGHKLWSQPPYCQAEGGALSEVAGLLDAQQQQVHFCLGWV